MSIFQRNRVGLEAAEQPWERPVRGRRAFGASFVMVAVIAGVALGASGAGEKLVTHWAFAAEKGRIQANTQGLARADEISNTFRMVAQVSRPGVVQISATGTPDPEAQREAQDAIRQQLHDQFGDAMTEEQLQRHIKEYMQQHLAIAYGSGFVFDDSGYILTNNHVVNGRNEIKVRLSDDRVRKATMVGSDTRTDLAVLKIDASDLHPLKFGDSDLMEVGDWVLAVGAPFGLVQSVTHGIISARDRSNIDLGRGISLQDFLQTDAAINPGNSGGPLMNLRGEVIGINTAIATSGDAMNAGVAFVIPSNMARKIADQLKSTGQVARGWMGLKLADLTEEDVEPLGLKDSHGVLADTVYEDSPAAKAGVQVEDVITKVDNRPVATLRKLQAVVADMLPGETVKLGVVRDGQSRQIDVVLGKQPDDMESFSRDARPIVARQVRRLKIDARTMRSSLSRSLRSELPISEEDFKSSTLPDAITSAQKLATHSGVLVVNSEDKSHDISPGDLIVGVNGKQVDSIRELLTALEAGSRSSPVELRVLSPNGEHTVRFSPSRD